MPFITNIRQWIVVSSIFIFFFGLHLSYKYAQYNDFKKEPLFVFKGKISNIYPKEIYQVIKIDTDDFTFFTSVKSNEKFNQNDYVKGYLITKKISFIEYLKGFYGLSFNLYSIPNRGTIQELSSFIENQHENPTIQRLFNALFLAVPINQVLREQCALFGISHLVAISGFHLSILSGILFFMLYYPYQFIHQKYFPYRNKKFDLLVMVGILLGMYLVLTGFVPSLLRAFIMLILGIFFARSHIKIISFETLLLVIFIVLVLFPTLTFSLSFWFSISGVFYIFLFLHYFISLPKIVQFFAFNIWIYLAMDPIVHYFFDVTSLAQLFSPLLTLVFTVFYPLELFLHFIGYGGLLDAGIEYGLNLKFETSSKITPFYVLVLYVVLSLLSIKSKKSFMLLNGLLIVFSLWLYVF
ncbi:MAG: ComEC/Rec2 family competence protein [Campylobacterota bacterium]|nr:ComEC/Rec2 family competence protein [Campylobacterota bacterium]